MDLCELQAQYLTGLPKHKSSSMISPSSAGHCIRQNVFNMLQYPASEPDAHSLMIMRRGNTIHEDLQGMWKDMGILVAEELVLNHTSASPWTKEKCTELRINGRLDAIVRIPPLYIAEIKSAKGSSFSRMLKDGPYEEYVSQLMLYMYLTQIKKGFLFVENKDTQEYAQFDFEYDEKKITVLLDNINLINHHVLSLTLPKQTLKSPSFTCKKLCNYTQSCWSSDPERYMREHEQEIRELVRSQTHFEYEGDIA